MNPRTRQIFGSSIGSMTYIGSDGSISETITGKLAWDFNNDRLGIGTSAPQSTLHVDGTVRIQGMSTNPVAGYVLASINANGDLDWVDPNTLVSGGGGGGTAAPAGDFTWVQYNDGGSPANLGADDGFTRNPITGEFTVVGDVAPGSPAATSIISLGNPLSVWPGVNIVHQDPGLGQIGLLLIGDDTSTGGAGLGTALATVDTATNDISVVSVNNDQARLQYNFGNKKSDVTLREQRLDIEWEDTSSPYLSRSIVLDANGIRFFFEGGNYTFPTTGGAPGQVLTDGGFGNLQWATPGYFGNFKINIFIPNSGSNTITHGLGTFDVIVQVWRDLGGSYELLGTSDVYVTLPNNNQVTVTDISAMGGTLANVVIQAP